MKVYILIFSVLLIFQPAYAQKKIEPQSGKSATNSVQQDGFELRAKVKTQAEEMNKAFVAGDYEKIYTLTYPKMRERIGKEKFLSQIKNGMKSMEADGFKLIAADAAEPKEIVKVGSQMFAVVPQKMKIQTPQGLFVAESSEIAISDDGGNTWTFVGGGAGSGASKGILKALFPTAANKLEIPEEKPPVPYQEQ